MLVVLVATPLAGPVLRIRGALLLRGLGVGGLRATLVLRSTGDGQAGHANDRGEGYERCSKTRLHRTPSPGRRDTSKRDTLLQRVHLKGGRVLAVLTQEIRNGLELRRQ